MSHISEVHLSAMICFYCFGSKNINYDFLLLFNFSLLSFWSELDVQSQNYYLGRDFGCVGANRSSWFIFDSPKTKRVCVSHPCLCLSHYQGWRRESANASKRTRAINLFQLCEWRVNGVCKFSPPIYHCSGKIINNGMVSIHTALGAKYKSARGARSHQRNVGDK